MDRFGIGTGFLVDRVASGQVFGGQSGIGTGFLVDRVASGQIFNRSLRLSHVRVIPPVLRTHL